MPPPRGSRRFDDLLAGVGDIGEEIVERFNLRRVYYWLLLSSLVGVVGGLGALGFKWLTDQCIHLAWGFGIGAAPGHPGGEPSDLVVHGSLRLWALVLVPAVGGLFSALLVYRFAPEAEGHGTDAAIKAYHRHRGIMRARIPIIKILASAFTLGSGGSAGREGPIAQIGAGFGSILGSALRLSDRERRILLAAGVAAGIGAIFRAPLAGAIFAAEVLYREPDMEAEVVVPALLSSIVAYTIYCSVHGFGHLFTGTGHFAFTDPEALMCYAALGLVCAFGGIAFASMFDHTTRLFKRWKISNYAKPVIGAAATGAIGLVGYLLTRDSSALAVMGSGYGTLQKGVSETASLAPTLGLSIGLLLFVAIGKMVTTSLTIGSGGSGGVFGPSMVIGGCLGAVVGHPVQHLVPPPGAQHRAVHDRRDGRVLRRRRQDPDLDAAHGRRPDRQLLAALAVDAGGRDLDDHRPPLDDLLRGGPDPRRLAGPPRRVPARRPVRPPGRQGLRQRALAAHGGAGGAAARDPRPGQRDHPAHVPDRRRRRLA